MGLDTKTYWLTDRQPQCDFDFDFENKKWQEDFTVIWSASFYVEIRWQETTSEDWEP
jgi:hypothetical protein